jgi:predicted acetyltransferase
MPFRASFYEHFGYGLVERKAEWTIPLSLIPPADCAGWRLATPDDRAAQADGWQSAVALGQCDVERSAKRWKHHLVNEEEGMVFINRPDSTGPVRAYAFITQEIVSGRSNLRVMEWSAESPETFVGLLGFFHTMRDQCSNLIIKTPADLPLTRLLREPQLPHRPVEHSVAEVRAITRMQLRILDHRKFLESLHLPQSAKGRVTISVKEIEGTLSRFTIDFNAGRASVAPSTAEPDFECLDRHWASIATGDLPASQAIRWNLARESTPNAAAILDTLSAGPLPFCREYF